MILFKNPDKQREFAKLSPRLREIVRVMEWRAWDMYRDELVVTDIFRADRMSTHHYYRAIDIAILEHGGMEGSETLREEINKAFEYGDGIHETIPKLDHGTAPHFHVQVRP